MSQGGYTTRTTCRVCGADKLMPLFSLGDLYVSTFVDKPGDSIGKAPLEMVYCENCTLLQLKHTAPQELMYSRHYWYRSGINPVITSDLKDIAEVAQRMVPLRQGDIVLDIGTNDGTMLKFYPEHVIRVGCEPADNLIEEVRKVTPYVIHDFWNYEAWQNLMGDKKAKIVTAIGMFYDMEDPGQFISDAAKVLDESGVFIAQLMCLRPMLEKNDVGNICHEHLEFYSYKSLVYLFEHNGLEIFKVEENSINGGSYRLFARHLSPFGRSFRKTGSIEYPEKLTKQDYQDFYRRIEENKQKCAEFIKGEAAKGKKIYAYGASTKGNTILQYYGLDHSVITGAADKSEEKWGKYTVGTNIPIVSEEEARQKADYFFVLPWAFFDTFFEREKEWMRKGGKFVVSIPEFRIAGL